MDTALQTVGGSAMSLYTQLIAGLVFPLHERLKRHRSVRVMRAMERSQWLTREELRSLQLERLTRFLQRIGKDVPYFRDQFEALGFDPSALKSLDELRQLPLLGKPEIRSNFDALVSDAAGPLEKFSTGGSSGEPLIFFRGKERVSHDVAAKWRATRWWGVDIGDPEIVVWGSPIELGAQDRVRLVRDRLLRTELLSAFEMSNANMLQFTQRLREFRPKMVFGYPSSIALLADYVLSNAYKVDDLGVEVVFVTSERLYDHQRALIERAFGCPVANGYGGRDAGFIAHECPEGSMHITAEDIIVEIVNEAGEVVPNGEQGEIVITHMATADFPFVRYRTGDVGSLSDAQCRCGRGLPLMEEIDGRTTDFIRAPDGTVLHGLALIYVLREMPQIKEFKIIQETLTRLTLQLVSDVQDRSAIEAEITAQFQRRLGSSLLVDFDYVEKIPREKSGKFRYVVSRLDNA